MRSPTMSGGARVGDGGGSALVASLRRGTGAEFSAWGGRAPPRHWPPSTCQRMGGGGRSVVGVEVRGVGEHVCRAAEVGGTDLLAVRRPEGPVVRDGEGPAGRSLRHARPLLQAEAGGGGAEDLRVAGGDGGLEARRGAPGAGADVRGRPAEGGQGG